MQVNQDWIHAFDEETQYRWRDIDNSIFDPANGRMLVRNLDNEKEPPRVGRLGDFVPTWLDARWKGPFLFVASWMLPTLNPWDFASEATANFILAAARRWAPNSIDFTMLNAGISGPYSRPVLREIVPYLRGLVQIPEDATPADGFECGRIAKVWAALGEAEARKQFLAGLVDRRLI